MIFAPVQSTVYVPMIKTTVHIQLHLCGLAQVDFIHNLQGYFTDTSFHCPSTSKLNTENI